MPISGGNGTNRMTGRNEVSMRRIKITSWDSRKEKKARFKRKVARIRKRGGIIYGGFFTLNLDDIGRSAILSGMNIIYPEENEKETEE